MERVQKRPPKGRHRVSSAALVQVSVDLLILITKSGISHRLSAGGGALKHNMVLRFFMDRDSVPPAWWSSQTSLPLISSAPSLHRVVSSLRSVPSILA